MELKERIALARKQAGLSQEQLGEKLGVSRQAVSKWESGAANPDVNYIVAMCRLFGVSSDWLLMGMEGAAGATPSLCSNCGGVVTPLDSFCPKCGQPQSPLPEGDGRYTLLLADHGEFSYALNAALFRLSQKPYCSCKNGAPWNTLSGPDEAGEYACLAPLILCRGLTFSEAQDAYQLLNTAGATVRVYPDGSGRTPAELELAQPVPPASLAYSGGQNKGGMSFGMTVLAVIIGLAAGILLLSFL